MSLVPVTIRTGNGPVNLTGETVGEHLVVHPEIGAAKGETEPGFTGQWRITHPATGLCMPSAYLDFDDAVEDARLVADHPCLGRDDLATWLRTPEGQVANAEILLLLEAVEDVA